MIPIVLGGKINEPYSVRRELLLPIVLGGNCCYL